MDDNLYQKILLKSVQNADISAITDLIMNADLNEKDDILYRTLDLSAVFGVPSVIEYICDTEEVDLNHRDESDMTFLHYACFESNSETVRVLLSRGADPTIYGSYNTTCLHEACWGGSIDVLLLLLNSDYAIGINTAQYSEDDSIAGWTPLHIACYKKNMKMVEYLLEYGANPLIKDLDGKLAFSLLLDEPDDKKEQKSLEIDHNDVEHVLITKEELLKAGYALSKTAEYLSEHKIYEHEAEACHLLACRLIGLNFGKSHEMTFDVVDRAAYFHVKHKKFDIALLLYRKVIDEAKDLYGTDSEKTMIYVGNYAKALFEAENYDEAADQYHRCMIALTRYDQNRSNFRTVYIIKQYAEVLFWKQNFIESRDYFEEVYTLCEKNEYHLLEDQNELLEDAMYYLGAIYFFNGEYGRSIEYFQNLLEKLKNTSGLDSRYFFTFRKLITSHVHLELHTNTYKIASLYEEYFRDYIPYHFEKTKFLSNKEVIASQEDLFDELQKYAFLFFLHSDKGVPYLTLNKELATKEHLVLLFDALLQTRAIAYSKEKSVLAFVEERGTSGQKKLLEEIKALKSNIQNSNHWEQAKQEEEDLLSDKLRNLYSMLRLIPMNFSKYTYEHLRGKLKPSSVFIEFVYLCLPSNRCYFIILFAQSSLDCPGILLFEWDEMLSDSLDKYFQNLNLWHLLSNEDHIKVKEEELHEEMTKSIDRLKSVFWTQIEKRLNNIDPNINEVYVSLDGPINDFNMQLLTEDFIIRNILTAESIIDSHKETDNNKSDFNSPLY